MISIGVTLGFAWRRCYGITIDAITRTYGDKLVEGSPYSGEVVFELLTALPFVFLLKPMQHWYITPKCMTVKDGGEPVPAPKSVVLVGGWIGLFCDFQALQGYR